MSHKKWAKEEKTAVVLELFRGQKTMQQICKEYGVRENIEYIRTANLQLDLQIIVCTLLKAFLIPASWRVRLTGVCRRALVSDIGGDGARMALTPTELDKQHHNGHRHPSMELVHKSR